VNPFSRLRQSLRGRVQQWFDRRTVTKAEWKLNHKRLYILPSKAGYGFLVLVGSLWLLATNFENNLIFMLSFLLTAFFVVSIHFTHGTLSGLRVKPVHAQSVFKGDTAAIELCLSQARARRREQIALRFDGGEPVMVSVEKSGDTLVTVLAPTAKRGYLEPGLLTVESVYPVGLLRVWSYLRFPFDAAVYPAPVPDRARSGGRSGSGEGHYTGTTGSEDYIGLKSYEIGESLRHVAWKQYAREQGLWSKQYGDTVDNSTWIDWNDYAGLDTEQRLSRMSWQACECEAADGVYGLRLPGTEIKPDQGSIHLGAVLRQLALFGIGNESGKSDEAS
jgi:uncharacterized protein (DUF58 family)